MPTNPMSLDGHVIIVTGAGQGIGRRAAEMALDLGACVVGADVSESITGLVAADDPKAGRYMPVIGNVAEPEFATRLVDESVERFGRVNGLVNNAGIVRAAMIDKMSVETWQQVINVNLSGAFYVLQAVGRHLIERAKAGETHDGAIVNISSDAGRKGTIGQINYGAAKSGVLGLTMSAAREWARYGIRVNSVCFGVVNTPMTETIRGEKFRDGMLAQIPLKRWAETEETSPPICFLLSRAASYITGQHLSVNGGYHIGF